MLHMGPHQSQCLEQLWLDESQEKLQSFGSRVIAKSVQEKRVLVLNTAMPSHFHPAVLLFFIRLNLVRGCMSFVTYSRLRIVGPLMAKTDQVQGMADARLAHLFHLTPSMKVVYVLVMITIRRFYKQDKPNWSMTVDSRCWTMLNRSPLSYPVPQFIDRWTSIKSSTRTGL